MAPHEVEVYPSWKRSPDGALQWEQPYGFQEKLYAKIAVPAGERGLFLIATGVSFWYKRVSGGKEVEVEDEEEIARRVRRAWIRMRHRFPALAAVAGPRGKVYRGLGSAAELDAWADATFRVRRGASAPDLFRDLARTEQITLWYLPEARELFLQAEHHHLDGRGLMWFWDGLFNTLAADDDDKDELTFERDFKGAPEAARLPPRSDDLLDLREATPGRGRAVALDMLAPLAMGDGERQVCMPVDLDSARVQARFRASTPAPPTQSSPSSGGSGVGARPPGPPGRNFSIESRLSDRDTREILDACRRRGYTITAAWHAAMAMATRETQRREAGPEAAGNKFVGFSNFDLRPYFPRPSKEEGDKHDDGYGDTDAYTVSNHHTVLPIALDVSTGRAFDDVARELAAFYRRGIAGAGSVPGVWAALPHMIDELLPDFTPLGADMTDTTPAVSSLGNIDAFIRKRYSSSKPTSSSSWWDIEDVWFGDAATGPWLECFMWAWRGRLVLCSCYSSAFYTARDVLAFHDEVTRVMMEGLGLGLYAGAPPSRI